MKSILIILSVLFLSFAVLAEDPNMNRSDGAGWFSPDCPSCAALQTPGGASLGNNKGVFRPDNDELGPTHHCGKKCRKRKGLPPVDTGQ